MAYNKTNNRDFGKNSGKTYGNKNGRDSGKNFQNNGKNFKKNDRPAKKPEKKFDKKEEFSRDSSNEDENSEIIYGRNSIMEAIKSEISINKILISESAAEGSGKAILAMAGEKGIVCVKTTSKKIDLLAGTDNNQGIMAYVSAEQYVDVSEILEAAKAKNQPPFVIILDEIQDPHNLGAIIRTADALGAHGVIIPKRRAAPLTGVVAKSSAGATAYVPVARVTNMVRTIEELKEQGLWIVGTEADGEKAFYQADLTGPIGLVIGSEGFGMGKLVRESCDYVLNIPMCGNVNSMNASVAAGIVMYEIFKNRNK